MLRLLLLLLLAYTGTEVMIDHGMLRLLLSGDVLASV